MISSSSLPSFPVDAILLLGPTGVGKSPLGDRISLLGFLGKKAHHLDFGAELRSIISPGGYASSYTRSELDFVHGVLERGLLLENEHFSLAKKIISLFLSRSVFRSNDILVLNGFPRHTGQARDISTLAIVHAVIVLDCSPGSILFRLKNNIGGDRSDRIDDRKELVEKKLEIFLQRTQPLIEHYARENSSVYRIPITDSSTPDDAYDRLRSLASAYPPVSFITEPPQR